MENPRDDGIIVEEGWSSSESGWTTYLSSPVHHEDDDYCHDIDVDDSGEEARDSFVDNNGFDSDDSMASDASSGPARQENTDNGGYNMDGRMQARAHLIKKIDKKGEDDLYDHVDDHHVEEGGDQDSSISPSIEESLQ